MRHFLLDYSALRRPTLFACSLRNARLVTTCSFGDDEQSRTVADEIDQQRAAYAEARLAGVDREEEEDAISELDISEGERAHHLLAPSPS
jgi:hypothetical protein